MLRQEQDAYGREILDHFEGRAATEIVERDDGYIDVSCGAATYFSEYDAWSAMEKEALTYVRGRVLDIGSGAGRHALYLQGQGHHVVCVDNSPLALEVCKRRGVKDTRLCPARRIGSHLGAFDTVLMMGNNFGLVENAQRAPRLLGRLARITTPEARIVAQTNNVYATANPDHLAYHERNLKRGRMAGQVRIRVRYRTFCGPWFDYLMVSPEEMAALIEETPWRIARILGEPANGGYIAILEKHAG